ncbi:MAG TPA: DUF4190 domain-containing protein [Phycisphaerae bacterium]|nr:DUF4190 domain-containing protein [Phycisphaerae bacterium]
MGYYVRTTGEENGRGPFSGAEMAERIRSGDIGPRSEVSTDGTHWCVCCSHAELAPLFGDGPQDGPVASSNPLDELASAVSQAAVHAPPVFHGAVSGRPAAVEGPRHRSYAAVQGSSKQRLAVNGFICSLLSLLFAFAPRVGLFSIVLAPLGLILSGVALSGMRRNRNYSGKGLAIAGLILGIITVGILLLYFLLVMGVLALMA